MARCLFRHEGGALWGAILGIGQKPLGALVAVLISQVL